MTEADSITRLNNAVAALKAKSADSGVLPTTEIARPVSALAVATGSLSGAESARRRLGPPTFDEHMAWRALQIKCPDCYGHGLIPTGWNTSGICSTCDGSGHVRPSDSRKETTEISHDRERKI